MSKLKSMVYYVLQDNGNILTKEYANFIKQPLKLEMFIPCDEEGNVLEEPISDYEPVNFWNEGIIDEKHNILYGEYEESKAKVLFEGFELVKNDFEKCLFNEKYNLFIGTFANKEFLFFNKFKSIEDLIPYNLEVTESIAKKYNL